MPYDLYPNIGWSALGDDKKVADFVDEDTLEAIALLWAKDGNPVYGVLVSNNPNAPQAVTSPIQAGLPKAGQSPVYVVADSKKGREREWYTGSIFLDFRNVTIKAYGPKTLVTQVIQKIGDRFNRQGILVYPSGAKFNAWVPIDSGLMEDPNTKAGNDVWIGTIEAEVWSVRKSG